MIDPKAFFSPEASENGFWGVPPPFCGLARSPRQERKCGWKHLQPSCQQQEVVNSCWGVSLWPGCRLAQAPGRKDSTLGQVTSSNNPFKFVQASLGPYALFLLFPLLISGSLEKSWRDVNTVSVEIWNFIIVEGCDQIKADSETPDVDSRDRENLGNSSRRNFRNQRRRSCGVVQTGAEEESLPALSPHASFSAATSAPFQAHSRV